MLKQGLRFKQLQKLSPQQIQLMKLVQLPTVSFEQQVEQELIENPALEEETEDHNSDDSLFEIDESTDVNELKEERSEKDDFEINIEDYIQDDDIPSYKTEINNYTLDDEDTYVPYAQEISFSEHLLSQVNTLILNDNDLKVAEFLIGSMDEDGYVRRDLSSLANDIAFSENIFVEPHIIERVLINHIQTLDPIGVGSRNLAECLIIQLRRKSTSKEIDLAIEILEKSFENFANRHFQKVMKRHNIQEESLRSVMKEIEKLNPKPGKNFASARTTKISQQITPDFSISVDNGELNLKLNGRNTPELKVNKSYRGMLESYKESKSKSKSQKDAILFIKQKLDSAKWFIDAVKQRQDTLYVTMNSIMNFQKEYFLTGDYSKLRPMILKDIADEIEMDISTVSRVASSKYVSTPYGTFLIRELFSESVKNEEGEDISTTEIKKRLEEVISKEDKKKPFTDDRLTNMLKKIGYPIARRTVAKYREQLNIPVARLRKEI